MKYRGYLMVGVSSRFAARTLRQLLLLVTLLAAPGFPRWLGTNTAAAASPVSLQGTISGATEILDESFKDNSAGWPIGTHRYFADDGYHIIAEPGITGLAAVRPQTSPQLADEAVEATVRFASASAGGAYGVALRADAALTRGYLLLVSSSGFLRLDRVTEHGAVTILSSRRHPALKRTDEPNTIRLAARGTSLSVLVNGEQVATAEDDGVKEAGGGGLLASPGAHVVAQRIKIEPASESDFAPPPAPRLLFEDDFFNNQGRWPAASNPPGSFTGSFQDDGFHLQVAPAERATVWSISAGALPRVLDVAAEADVHLVDGPRSLSFGLTVRGSDDFSQGYRLLVTGDRHVTLRRLADGTSQELLPWTQTAALLPGTASNTIRLAVHGDSLSVFVNGIQVASAKDPNPLPAGRVMLHVTTGLEVAFRRLSVAEATAQEVMPISGPPLYFEDSFTDNRHDWLEDEGQWFDGDGYHLSREGDDRQTYASRIPTYTATEADVTAQAELRFVSQNGTDAAGISIRAGNPARGYRLLIDPRGSYTLLRASPDGLSTVLPWQPHPALQEGDDFNLIGLAARGKQLAITFNGSPAAVIEDDGTQDPGWFGLVIGPNAHAVFRYASVVAPSDRDFAPPPPHATAPGSVSRVPAPAACLPEVSGATFVLSGVKAKVTNPCGVPRAFGLGVVVLDKAGGQPVAESATVHWDAPAGDARDIFVPVDPKGGTAVTYLRSSSASGDTSLVCVNVNAAACLPVAPELQGAVQALGSIDAGKALLKTAAESGSVIVLHGQTGIGASGDFDRRAHVIALDPKLDTYGDWERAAVLAHELQHAADYANGLPFEGTANCLARESDAFRREAEVWNALWHSKLGEPQNLEQFSQYAVAVRVQQDPAGFTQTLAQLYRHNCA